MRPSGAGDLSGGPVSGTWFRAVRTIHLRSPLQTVHTQTVPSRFHAARVRPGFQILYLAEDPIVSLYEVGAMLGSPTKANAPNVNLAVAILPIQVSLRSVADLTAPSGLRAIDASIQELTGDWEGYAKRNPGDEVAAGEGQAISGGSPDPATRS